MTGVDERLAELAREHGLDGPARQRLARYLRIVASEAGAPTTVTEPHAAADLHVADALSGLVLRAVRAARTVADLGSGAGVPGLVLAAALPQATVHLVESAGRKCTFMRVAIAEMGLANAAVVHARAEDWPEGIGAHDLVTARAVAPLPVLVEYAAPLLRMGGAFVAWKGRRDAAEEADGLAAASATGLEMTGVHQVSPFPAARARHLHEYRKTSETPDRFPRRPGMARKRPIGRT